MEAPERILKNFGRLGAKIYRMFTSIEKYPDTGLQHAALDGSPWGKRKQDRKGLHH